MKTALLVIDVLNDFLDPAGALYCGDAARALIPVIRSLLDHFHREAQPVFYLTDAHAPDDAEFALFPPHAVSGTWGAAILPELAPESTDRVLAKARFSGFYKTSLEAELAREAPDEVWVSGVCTSICVMDTVGDLRNRGYPVLVVDDAVADFDPQFHQFALLRMERVYGAKRRLWQPRPTAKPASA